MLTIRPLLPLLLAAGVMLGGNGLQSTLIALRGASEGFSPTLIGLMGTTYYFGFVLGCAYAPRLLQSVGHIRTFAALGAATAALSLLMVLIIDPVTWNVIRFVTGFTFAGLFTVIDSWLNASVSNRDRGKVISVYKLADILAVTGSQYMIPIFGTDGYELFALISIMLCLAIVPVAIGDRSNPAPPESFRLDFRRVWEISPIACLSCLSIGITNGAFRLVGPVYAEETGLSIADVATFMSAGILGGAVLQYPLGWLSDRVDRRYVLLVSTVGASLASLLLVIFAGTDAWRNILGVFLFGALALPLYSLAAAHANDHARSGEFVQVSAVLLILFSVGAMFGPLGAAMLMEIGGPKQLFVFIGLVHAWMVVITLYRIARQPRRVPVDGRAGFAWLQHTSVLFNRLARKPTSDRESDREN